MLPGKEKRKKRNEVLRLNWTFSFTQPAPACPVHSLVRARTAEQSYSPSTANRRLSRPLLAFRQRFSQLFLDRVDGFFHFSHLQEFTAVKCGLQQENYSYNFWPQAHESSGFHPSAEPVWNRKVPLVWVQPPMAFACCKSSLLYEIILITCVNGSICWIHEKCQVIG